MQYSGEVLSWISARRGHPIMGVCPVHGIWHDAKCVELLNIIGNDQGSGTLALIFLGVLQIIMPFLQEILISSFFFYTWSCDTMEWKMLGSLKGIETVPPCVHSSPNAPLACRGAFPSKRIVVALTIPFISEVVKCMDCL